MTPLSITGSVPCAGVDRRPGQKSPSERENETCRKGGGGQNERSNGQHPERRCGYGSTGPNAESPSPAKLHSQYPNDGTYGDQDQRNDRLIAAQWPETSESHCNRHGDRETRSAPGQFGTLLSEARITRTASFRCWVRTTQSPRRFLFRADEGKDDRDDCDQTDADGEHQRHR
jgi:hypothetical protein